MVPRISPAYECAAAQSMDPWAATKKAVTPASVRVPTQRLLVPSFTYARPRTIHLSIVEEESYLFFWLNTQEFYLQVY